jgi:hypothetical protein
MEYDQPWGKLSGKQASCSKFALGRAPNRKTCWTQIKTYGAKTYKTKTCGTQSRNNGGRADDLELR